MNLVTEKAYQKSLNRVIDHINAHLTDAIDLETLAGVSNISKYHLHRIFKAYMGESIGAFVSRIRLEKAAQKLKTTGMSLTDIAGTVGYKSQYSLSKAFKKHFGITPSEFRHTDVYFSPYAKTNEIDVLAVSPNIRVIPDINLIYIRIIAKYGSSKAYDRAWYDLLAHAEEKGILNDKSEYIGMSFDDPAITKDEQCRFYACITTKEAVKPEGAFGFQHITSGKYAVFTHRGPYAELNALYKGIYLDWIPKNRIKLREGTPFEKYLNSPDEVPQQDLITEIYIPIQ